MPVRDDPDDCSLPSYFEAGGERDELFRIRDHEAVVLDLLEVVDLVEFAHLSQFIEHHAHISSATRAHDDASTSAGRNPGTGHVSEARDTPSQGRSEAHCTLAVR